MEDRGAYLVIGYTDEGSSFEYTQEKAQIIQKLNPMNQHYPRLNTIRELYKELYKSEAPEAVILFIFNGHYLNK